MTIVVVHHDPSQLPRATDNLIPVQIYGLNGLDRGDISVIGNPIIDPLKRLGVSISSVAMDFMSIALAVTAADTFVQRNKAADGWAREITLNVPLIEPNIWDTQRLNLEKALHFLSGDIWTLEFEEGGYKPPKPYRHRDRFHLAKLSGLDCICLFSGGLDSAIGAIDLISNGKKPLLVSHAYKGDSAHQEAITSNLRGRYSKFTVNANPTSYNGETDITMRTRSINFLAFAAVGISAVANVNNLNNVELFIPENGFISLNAPLTPRRIGSLSTRTTHPFFMESIQEIFNATGIQATIINPYQFKTKGEMIQECNDSQTLQSVIPNTVSCSKWKRKSQQCGHCVPCLIRRASISAGAATEPMNYLYQDLHTVLVDGNARDDILAVMRAISQLGSKPIGPWISESGPLPTNIATRTAYKDIFVRGLREVESYLKREGVL